MAASQADGADGAGEVLTQDKLPTESAVHMPNEAPEEMTVAERDCTSGHNSDEGSILDVPSEAPADTRIESEAIVTPTRTPTGDGKATTQGLALATNCEAPLDPQHEVMCAQQPATSESPPDPPAEKEKAAVAQETVKPRLNDGPGIHAGEVEEGTDPGSPPVMLPDVDKMSRTEAVQAEYACCAAAIIYIFITQHSENGESTQDRDSATGKPSAVVLCNSNSPEDARDAERGEMEDTTNETITVWRTK
ncbi:hypothetical protein BU23DRAFT_557900 [Bimuria novae-zelandiae CBS 107.79]|uniref:Uncharacterized protein n=1 Tax=Bimuria novae-zelandiae CBS 107.79 TaxID=1447943 RepID=A0A6A5V2G1_9PLEO|nr:hypothetical protein BU23DRAFT_557900 [Bimuria novae-zelandiae CBS 107.79]